ncbi:MAG: DUF4465 domain-containing protein [bacterium]
MKKTLLAILAIVFCSTIAIADETISNYSVPEDYTNDLWLDIDFTELVVGGTYQINAQRMPQIVASAVSSTTAHPNYTYEIVEGSSISVSEAGLITASEAGRSMIKVMYESVDTFSTTYAACSPINAAYMVVNVVAAENTSTIAITHSLPVYSTYETFYYAVGDSYVYNFTVSATDTVATDTDVTVTVVLNGETLEANTDGGYTANLRNRQNVIEITATDGTNSVMTAKCIDARKVDVTIENATNPGADFVVGDDANISFYGITMPVYKIAGIYNPSSNGWGGTATMVKYSNDILESVESNVSLTQYSLATNNTISITFTEAGEYVFNNGYIEANWWGSALGADKGETGDGYGATVAPTGSADLSKMPAFKIQVLDSMPTGNEEYITLDLTQPTNPTSFEFDANNAWVETYNETEYNTFESQIFTFTHLLDQDASWSYWDGFTVANSISNDYSAFNFYTDQWDVMAMGGKDGVGEPYLVSNIPSNWSDYSPKTQNVEVKFTENKARTFGGVYVCNTTYLVNSVTKGDYYAKQFNDGDSAVVIFHGYVNGVANGNTVKYYLADYRTEGTENHYLNTGWEWVDLTALGEVTSLQISIVSSDNGSWGMNTPAYCAFDKFTASVANTTVEDDNTATDITPENSLIVYGNDGNIYVENAETAIVVYNIMGRVIYSGYDSTINVGNQSIVIVRANNQAVKVMVK